MNDSLFWHCVSVTRENRERINGHRACVVWVTGLSGAGKSTLAHSIERALHEQGCKTFVFDGDNVRHGLCSDLGFSQADRHENIRRIGEMSRLFVQAGVIALNAFISPYRSDRERLRHLIGDRDFIEVYCRCPLEVCERRDRKDIYRKARAGEIAEFTGISGPYEEPLAPELALDTGTRSLHDCVGDVVALLRSREVIPPSSAAA